VPGEADKAKGIKYSVEIDGEFATPISLEVLRGVVFGASNEDQSTKP
jgi:hypothetical protein